MSIKPRTPMPDVTLPLVGGGQFTLAHSAPASFTLVIVYIGQSRPPGERPLAFPIAMNRTSRKPPNPDIADINSFGRFPDASCCAC